MEKIDLENYIIESAQDDMVRMLYRENDGKDLENIKDSVQCFFRKLDELIVEKFYIVGIEDQIYDC